MDRTSLIGIILGFFAVGAGMILKGIHPSILINPAAILIIIVGTIASVLIAFPTNEIKNLPALLKAVFREQKLTSQEEYIKMFVEFAALARKEGLLSLEARVAELDDHFLKNGLNLAIDGQSPEFIRDVMMEEIEAMEERHQANAAIFSQAGTYAPTLGVLGAVLGLIAALGNMEDIEALGHAIAAAFVATLMGIFSGYVLWHPFANKLRRKSKQEVKIKKLIVEGVLSVQEGQAPAIIQQKLASYLPIHRRIEFLSQGEKQDAQ
ncbi:flagellar motor stator protein MotA [Calidifontibacillus erzurumensis]|uniref:Flagellar motor stator protein MotA n=1 Tax=Calidifontibacillus erzurumensis TaxID=2741433 RepID=A0A8J8GI76_9BACI|nr:flagellar motor stator protein MotA [Calidifontibacillus erzurumensis]NSL52228.1 flagellar motor stator protein MotA [Calidifontibacillus erzurumensis]